MEDEGVATRRASLRSAARAAPTATSAADAGVQPKAPPPKTASMTATAQLRQRHYKEAGHGEQPTAPPTTRQSSFNFQTLKPFSSNAANDARAGGESGETKAAAAPPKNAQQEAGEADGAGKKRKKADEADPADKENAHAARSSFAERYGGAQTARAEPAAASRARYKADAPISSRLRPKAEPAAAKAEPAPPPAAAPKAEATGRAAGKGAGEETGRKRASAGPSARAGPVAADGEDETEEERRKKRKMMEERFWQEYEERKKKRAEELQKLMATMTAEAGAASPARRFLTRLSIKELKSVLEHRRVDFSHAIERDDLIQLILDNKRNTAPEAAPPSARPASGRPTPRKAAAAAPGPNEPPGSEAWKRERERRRKEEEGKLQAHLREAQRERRREQARKDAEEKERASLQERIMVRVARWAKAKNHSLREMMNDICVRREKRGMPSLPVLPPAAGWDELRKTYKRLLVLIHPDKVDQTDVEAHLEATEIFKVLSTAHAKLKLKYE